MFGLVLMDERRNLKALEVTETQLASALMFGTKFPATQRAYGRLTRATPEERAAELEQIADLYVEEWAAQSVRLVFAKPHA
jgi:hypothetical protein